VLASALGLLLWGAPGLVSAQFSLGSPESSLIVRARLPATLELGLRGDLTDRGALRLGPSLGLTLFSAPGAALALDLAFLRSYAPAPTYDLEIVPRLRVPLGAGTAVVGRAGAIGYYGAETFQRGVIGLFAVGLDAPLTEALRLTLEVGAMVAHAGSRPRASIGLSFQD
jgi:hypothetical protein